MGESRKTVLEAAGISGQICVEFELVEDYYSHAIWLLVDNDRIPIFKSSENPALPSIPCFTHLHQQGKNLFLTGANGPCHWSMSVEVGDAHFNTGEVVPGAENFLFAERYGLNAPHRDSSDPTFHFLFFDVACRLKADIPRLGNVYTKSAAVEYSGACSANSGQLCQSQKLEKPKIGFGANTHQDIFRFDPNPTCLLSCEENSELRISSADRAVEQYPATIQWSYGFWVM